MKFKIQNSKFDVKQARQEISCPAPQVDWGVDWAVDTPRTRSTTQSTWVSTWSPNLVWAWLLLLDPVGLFEGL